MIWQVQIGDGSNYFLLQIMPGASLKLAVWSCVYMLYNVCYGGDCSKVLNYV